MHADDAHDAYVPLSHDASYDASANDAWLYHVSDDDVHDANDVYAYDDADDGYALLPLSPLRYEKTQTPS